MCYVFQMYIIYYQNVFIKTSTALTTVIAFSRYLGICHPLHFRHCARLLVTKATILFCFLFWLLLNLPLLWSYQVQTMLDENGSALHLIDTGPFTSNFRLQVTFTYIWAIIGYFFPLAIITFCNIKLVQALRRSQRLRQTNARYCSTGSNRSRITITLVALTTMYLLLMSPSEIVHFYIDTVHATRQELDRAIACTNLLQAVNFSCHFILYCIVNSTFRNIMFAAFRSQCRGGGSNANGATYHSTMSNVSYSTKLQMDTPIGRRGSLDGNTMVQLPQNSHCLAISDRHLNEDTAV